MDLVQQVADTIKGSGESFLKDLWHPDDLEHIIFVSEKLVLLKTEMAAAASEADKRQCLDRAAQWMDNLKALALSRANIALQDVQDQIARTFVVVLLNGCVPYLGTLASILESEIIKS